MVFGLLSNKRKATRKSRSSALRLAGTRLLLEPLEQRQLLSATATSLLADPTLVPLGQATQLTATVTDQGTLGPVTSGQVEFKYADGSAVLAEPVPVDLNGNAVLPVLSLGGVGTYDIVAYYQGYSDDTTSLDPSTSDPVAIQVVAAASTVELVSSANPSQEGDLVTVTATVTGPLTTQPTGSVTFSVDDVAQEPVTLTDGAAQIDLSALSVGSHKILAVYSGDDSYTGDEASLEQIVDAIPVPDPVATTTTLGSSLNPAAYGVPVTVTATVGADLADGALPTGSVTFSVDGTAQDPVALVDGAATIDLTSLTIGTHTITASYAGEGFISSEATLDQVVEAIATTTTLTASPEAPVYGQNVKLTATVTADSSIPLTGMVEFVEGDTVLGARAVGEDGSAVLVLRGLKAGDHTIVARFVATDVFSASTSDELTTSVAKADTRTLLVGAVRPVTAGQPVTLTALVTPSTNVSPTARQNDRCGPSWGIAPTYRPTGTVVFMDGDTVIGEAKVDRLGMARLTTTTLALGTHSITAVYQGDDNYSVSTSNAISQEVVKAQARVQATSDPRVVQVNQDVSLVATVLPWQTRRGAVPTGTVTFTEVTNPTSPVVLGTVDLINGKATLKTKFSTSGVHLIVVSYSGDATYGESQGWLTQVVQPLPTPKPTPKPKSGGGTNKFAQAVDQFFCISPSRR